MIKPEDLTTSRKALTINIDSQVYGTFAEIGAGQEVAGYFFKAGGAAGTVAKSMSAYDMKFSDEIYGKSKRYVSHDRLEQMLEHEYTLLVERLGATRGSTTCFFAYANTVAAKSYRGNNECHGWMGVRFQLTPESEPNDIIIHVRMLDKTNIAQQEALGIIGVNLVYGAFIYSHDPRSFIESLADNLGTARIEVDMIHFAGPEFKDVDNRVLSLQLVEQGLTNAVMFSPNNEVLQPAEALYKKHILIERGSFRPVTKVNVDMLSSAASQFLQDPEVAGDDVVVLMEITMNNLLATGFDLQDFIARIEILASLGYNVLISNYPEYFRLSAYFRRYTNNKIGMVMGINHLLAIFDESYYEKLDGGILEAFGRLFKENVKLYIYPMQHNAFQHYKVLQGESSESDEKSHVSAATRGVLITAENVQIPMNLKSLYMYLKEAHSIESIQGFNRDYLHIFSRDILTQIKNGETEWEEAVPKEVVKMIKERKLFNYGNNADNSVEEAAKA